MSISDELQKLDDLRRNGTISDDEFELAKKKVLQEPQDAIHSDQLEEIKFQNELAQLDREWELERENYMVSGKRGRYIPGKASSLFGGIVIVGFGIFWTLMAASMTGHRDASFDAIRVDSSGVVNTETSGNSIGSIFPLFGVLFVLFGAGMSLYSFTKASQYEEAKQRYQDRRWEMQNRNGTS